MTLETQLSGAFALCLAAACGPAPLIHSIAAHPTTVRSPTSCSFTVARLDVSVELAGLPSIVVADAEGTIELPGDLVRVRRPFEFSGRAASLFFELKRACTMDGVTLAPGATAIRLRAGSARMLEGAFVLPQSAGTVLGVPVDCAELTPLTPETRPEVESVEEAKGLVRLLSRTPIELRAAPDAGSSSVRLDGTLLGLFETETRAGFSHVARAWSDGTRLDGWIASDVLRPPSHCERKALAAMLRDPPDPLDSVIEMQHPCDPDPSSWSLRASIPNSSRWRVPAQPRASSVMATVSPGTIVYVRPGRGPWATITDRDVEIERPAENADWVRVLGPRIASTDPEAGAWIARASVH